MIDYIELGGKKRPVHFGNNALRVFSIEKNVPLSELGNIAQMNYDVLMSLLFAGVRDGHRKEKVDFKEGIEEFCDWLDEGKKLEEMMNLYVRQYAGENEGNQESPQKVG
jgi:hypothetical protein